MGKFWLSMQRQCVSECKMCNSENNDWNESAYILT